MTPIYAPSIIQKDRKGRAIAIMPLQAVTLPVHSCADWNARVYKHVYGRLPA